MRKQKSASGGTETKKPGIDTAIIVALITAIGGGIITGIFSLLSALIQPDYPSRPNTTQTSVTPTAHSSVSSALFTSPGATTPTQYLSCGVPHSNKINKGTLLGTVVLASPTGECVGVTKKTTFQLEWSGVDAQTYLWILVYSPLNSQYYPTPCGNDPLPAQGKKPCSVTFSSVEPYEAIIILANQAANQKLKNGPSSVSYDDLPSGIEEQTSLSVHRLPP